MNATIAETALATMRIQAVAAHTTVRLEGGGREEEMTTTMKVLVVHTSPGPEYLVYDMFWKSRSSFVGYKNEDWDRIREQGGSRERGRDWDRDKDRDRGRGRPHHISEPTNTVIIKGLPTHTTEPMVSVENMFFIQNARECNTIRNTSSPIYSETMSNICLWLFECSSMQCWQIFHLKIFVSFRNG